MAFTIIWCFYMCSPLNIIWLSSIFIKVYKLYKHLEWWHDLGSFGVHKMSTTDKLWKFHGGAQTSGRIIKWVWIQSVKNHQLSLKFQEHISLVNGRFLRNQNGIHIYIYIISNQLLFSLIENGIYLPVLEHGPEIPKCSVVKVAISMDFFTFGDLSFWVIFRFLVAWIYWCHIHSPTSMPSMWDPSQSSPWVARDDAT